MDARNPPPPPKKLGSGRWLWSTCGSSEVGKGKGEVLEARCKVPGRT